MGIVFILYFKISYFQESKDSLLNFSSLYDLCQGIISYATDLGFGIICFVIILGLALKSMLFSFFTSTSDSIETPYTSYAIIGSISFLIPSIYIIIRLLPIFSMSLLAIKTLFVLGVGFSVLCSLIAVFKKQIRKIVACCICVQVGLILASLSIFSTAAGIFHLINTAFSSALLILMSGIVIGYFNNCDNIKYMGGLRKNHPVLALIFGCAILCFTGLFFGGAFSRISLLGGFLSKGLLLEYFIFLICCFLIAVSLIILQ